MRTVEPPPKNERKLGQAVLRGLGGLALLAATLAPFPAVARHHHHGRVTLARHIVLHSRHVAHARPSGHVPGPRVHVGHIRPGSYTPPFSVYAVDGNSGRVLYGRDENELRHPASLTKVMTLYLLFEQLEKQHLALDSELRVSTHAAAQEPTKLGLRPGATIRVEDAIKAIVTKSANDMAVAVAEQIGGDEDNFARIMTRKAHALGMSRTLYRNASGLPNDEQLTTARDLVTLGRAIHDHFPQYYHYFSTPSFRYAGQFMPNHNHLMEHVEGMDGIKTGYTRLSGFNLLTSVKRNGHYLVAVVLGGKTRLGRDHIMEELINAELDKCATTRTASIIEENPALEQVAEAIPVVQTVGEAAPAVEAVNDDQAENEPASQIAPMAPAARVEPAAAPAQFVAPAQFAPAQVAALSSDTGVARVRPAFVPGMPNDRMATGSIRPRQTDLDGSTAHVTDAAAVTPSGRGLREAAKAARREKDEAARQAKEDAARLGRVHERVAPIKLAKAEVAKARAESDDDTGRPAVAHGGGWMIQIGATDDVAKANDLLARARTQSHGALGAAKPFTEKVHKGAGTLYRARFAGLEESSAEGACKSLKRSGFACFATRN
jgi:D-alanyl-D-alanine carboxypeptidase